MRIGQNSVIAFLSQALTSVAGFVATVYIARELGEATLGVYSLVLAVVIWLKIIGGLGIQTALKKRLSEPGDDGPYLVAGVVTQLVVFVVLAGVVVGLGPWLSSYLRGTPVGTVVALFALTLSFAFVTTALEGQNRVHIASLLAPADRLVRSVVQILLIVVGFGLTGLLFGYGLGALVGTLLGVVFLSVPLALPTREHFEAITGYAKYSWLSNLSNRAFASMDTLVLGLFVADGLIGVYEVAWNLASVLAVFGVAIGTAMFPAMSELSSEGNLEEVRYLFSDSMSFTGLLLIPGLVGAALVGDLVLTLYGQSFSRGHLVLVVLTFSRTVYAYEFQIVNTLNALDRPDRAFRIDGVFITVNVALNLVLVWQFGWVGAAAATAVSAVVALALGHRAVQDVVGVQLPLDEIGRQLLAAVVMGLVVAGGRYLLAPTLVTGVVLVVVGGVVYFTALTGLSVRFREVVVDNVPF
ncbi:oligosaccharide flippase family protein [Salinigranum halophilum]|uniref:oligosaccharide flippase family protein n=1 Tax=Salinigranum halophilum TaxID=2565931 RepID=UPI0010A77699|nr:oligosaccharide flippase family protein [Salinigranum halophilum]